MLGFNPWWISVPSCSPNTALLAEKIRFNFCFLCCPHPLPWPTNWKVFAQVEEFLDLAPRRLLPTQRCCFVELAQGKPLSLRPLSNFCRFGRQQGELSTALLLNKAAALQPKFPSTSSLLQFLRDVCWRSLRKNFLLWDPRL